MMTFTFFRKKNSKNPINLFDDFFYHIMLTEVQNYIVAMRPVMSFTKKHSLCCMYRLRITAVEEKDDVEYVSKTMTIKVSFPIFIF